MSRRPTFSLIVPTRRRPAPLRRLLDSLAETAARPDALEVVLVVDADDPASAAARHDALALRHVVAQPGLTMGALNTEGYEASSGDYLMLLNDDVVARTPAWDGEVRACFRRFPDGIVLVHPNDTLLREHLCTFPVVSRRFCELAGGICPREYARYRIDDHIEDVFNLLGVLGERRTVYLPEVIFEHLNAVEHPGAGRVYQSDPAVLALDAPRFEALFASRKELVLRLLDHMDRRTRIATRTARGKLERVTDPLALRVPGRQWVWSAGRLRPGISRFHRLRALATWCAALPGRARACVRQRGYRGLARAVGRRLRRLLPG
jgi:glycosyltransferase involved in cell wall biosynthesis